MLVLTRKQTETIHIGDDIVLKVIQTGSGSVKIGIDAPRDIRVVRGELVDKPVTLKGNAPAHPRKARTDGGVRTLGAV